MFELEFEELVEIRLEEILQYLTESDVDLSTAICHDMLYDIAWTSVVDDKTAEAEARAEEERLGDPDEQN